VTVDEPGYWNELYRAGRSSWDMGTPAPALVHVFSRPAMTPGSVLVLGCGSGYDAVWLGERGYAVTAVDFSDEAITRARQVAGRRRVQINYLLHDIFTLSPEYDNTFDYVVEYVTYCAISPSRRDEFATVVSHLIRPGGLLVALFFPLDERPGGPPFAVQMDEALHLFGRYLNLESAFEPEHSVTPRKGRELMTLWRKVVLEGDRQRDADQE
jgi:methyl halide transferase